MKWLDIFISFNKHATPEAARTTMPSRSREDAAREARPPATDFVALVKQYDNGLASGAGGVGVGSKRGEIQPPDVEATVWALKPGRWAG